MSVAALKTPMPAPARTHYRFSVRQYQEMVQTGVLGPDDHVELLEGWIIEKMGRTPPHDGTINLINALLLPLLPKEFVLRVQSSFLLARSVPEPDFAIVRGPGTIYMKRHPEAADAALLIEVADSSRLADRKEKGRLYADAHIPEFWLINLVEEQVEVYTEPRAGKSPGYRQRKDYKKGERVPMVLDGRVIACLAVDELCPVTA